MTARLQFIIHVRVHPFLSLFYLLINCIFSLRIFSFPRFVFEFIYFSSSVLGFSFPCMTLYGSTWTEQHQRIEWSMLACLADAWEAASSPAAATKCSHCLQPRVHAAHGGRQRPSEIGKQNTISNPQRRGAIPLFLRRKTTPRRCFSRHSKGIEGCRKGPRAFCASVLGEWEPYHAAESPGNHRRRESHQDWATKGFQWLDWWIERRLKNVFRRFEHWVSCWNSQPTRSFLVVL